VRAIRRLNSPWLQAGTATGYLTIEQGVKDYDISLWNGLFAPLATPKPIIDELSEIMLRMPNDATVQRAMSNFGSTPSVSTPDQFRKELHEETTLWESGLQDVMRK
jgi:tripartite-type tricarboxylate transporter receptor subunit TctC